MNPSDYHILNGDALREHFPSALGGEVIVARECLVDGPSQADTLEELYQKRAKFIAETYGGYSVQDYFNNAVVEFSKLQGIPAGSEVCLWFEDDLFCQVNFWFCLHLLEHHAKDVHIYLVRPREHTQYGFGAYSAKQLVELWQQRQPISEQLQLAQLWDYYQSRDLQALLATARSLQPQLPFILTAVEAHIASLPTGASLGRPLESLKQIVQELGTDDFGGIFKEFCKRQSIYGFGDVQVRRLYDELLAEE